MTQTGSKPKKKRIEIVTFSDGTKQAMTTSQAGGLRQKNTGIPHFPKEKLSTELPEPKQEIKDDYDSLKYPPPGKNPDFRKFWAEGIDGIVARENFTPAHLGLFEAYCNLRVMIRTLDEFIREHGYTYRTSTLTGETRRSYPEVAERTKALSQLAQYAKLLDIIPKKDKSNNVAKDAETDWE